MQKEKKGEYNGAGGGGNAIYFNDRHRQPNE